MNDTALSNQRGMTGNATPPSREMRVWHVLTFGGRVSRRLAVVLWLCALIGASLYLGWGFIVAAGLASVVVGFLPCAAMCALGLCMDSGSRCSKDTTTSAQSEGRP